LKISIKSAAVVVVAVEKMENIEKNISFLFFKNILYSSHFISGQR